MKIISNVFGEIQLTDVTCHGFYFKSIHMEHKFREQVELWAAGKEIEDGRFFIVNNQIDLNLKSTNYLMFSGGQQLTLDSKMNSGWLKNIIYNQDDYYGKFNALKNEFEMFLLHFTPSLDDYSFEFDLTNFTPEHLFKMTQQSIVTKDERRIYPIDYRKVALSQWFHNNANSKQSIVVYFYPEHDMSVEQLKELMHVIEKNGGWFIFISRNEKILKNFSINQTHVIKENGLKYDLAALKRELIQFDMATQEHIDALCIELALKDLDEDYSIMNENYRQFLQSAKF